jgi:hypothetical protein
MIGTEFVGDDDNPAGAVAMFNLNGGLILALYTRSELAKDAQVPLGPSQAGEFSIGHLVASKDDVDTLLARAGASGATLTAPHVSALGGSTPATSRTSTDTYGRSSGTHGSTAGARDGDDLECKRVPLAGVHLPRPPPRRSSAPHPNLTL